MQDKHKVLIQRTIFLHIQGQFEKVRMKARGGSSTSPMSQVVFWFLQTTNTCYTPDKVKQKQSSTLI